MRIGLIGKFPPIQGGVSMRTYWTAHRLAQRGHDVQVVTNAKEVPAPFRMHMRDEDWTRCEADYGDGRVVVHWTDPPDRSQRTVPQGSAFVSKLAGLAARVHGERPFDVVLSHYLEPYGVAGHLVADMTGVPHVVRMAGSDAGRLWHHPQMEAVYDHVLRSAHAVLAVGSVAERAVAHGVDPARIAPGGSFAVPEELFDPAGPALDFAVLHAEAGADIWGGFAGDRPHFGVYGKLGDTKGSFALLAALARLVRAGHDIGLVAMAHGLPQVEQRFRDEARALGLEGNVLQIPFLPHWRVPELLRGCLAVCCLEQDFPISMHNPIVPREVLLSGACLIGSTEVIRKLPDAERLAHGYSCIAVRDINDLEELTAALAAAADRPEHASAIGARGRTAAREMQQDFDFAERLERILEAAAARRVFPARAAPAQRAPAAAEVVNEDSGYDPLFRLQSRCWPLAEEAYATLVPVRDPRAHLMRVEERCVVAFTSTELNPLVVDDETARILELCDGRRTAAEIARAIGDEDELALARRIAWIQRLFAMGLIGLRDSEPAGISSL